MRQIFLPVGTGYLMSNQMGNKEYHFVIKFDEGTGIWSWDTDVEEARFDDGTIYNSDTDKWLSGYESEQENLVGQLLKGIWAMNLVNGKPEVDE